ncbi:MAG: EamA family transporter [Candidatus Acidiferrales bacterium]
MPTQAGVERPSLLKLAAAYAAIYFIWGGTYLAIRYAVEVLPPFLMMGTRHLIAGTLLYVTMRWRGAPRPERIHWVGAIIAGSFLFLGDHGLLAWAEQRVPSGLAALLSATLPFWMVAAARLKGTEPRLSVRALAGLTLGLAGVAFLVGPGALGQIGWSYLAGVGAILFGAILWVAGSLYARGAQLPSSPLLSAAMQMISGGALLFVAGILAGEAGRVHMNAVTPRSMLSLAYLILFGSIVAFGSYVWLLRVSSPSRISTYAYVNPLVAVFLGCSMAGEAVTWGTIVAAALILIGVALVNTRGASESAAEKESVLTMRPDPLEE